MLYWKAATILGCYLGAIQSKLLCLSDTNKCHLNPGCNAWVIDLLHCSLSLILQTFGLIKIFLELVTGMEMKEKEEAEIVTETKTGLVKAAQEAEMETEMATLAQGTLEIKTATSTLDV